MKQDDDVTEKKICDDDIDDLGDFFCVIYEDDFDNQQEVLSLDQECHDETFRITGVPLPKKWSFADTVIACTSLSNLQHPARNIAPPLLKRRKSTINILPKSDIVPSQSLPLPKAGGDKSVPQPKAGGDHNVPQHEKATCDIAKLFLVVNKFTMTPQQIIPDKKYSMVYQASQLAIAAHSHQQALAGASVGTPSVYQFPGGPSLEMDRQTQEVVSIYAAFCSSI